MPSKSTYPSKQPEYARAYRRERYKVTGPKCIKDWRRRNPEKRAKYREDWQARHPEKYAAHNAVWSAIHTGKMKPAKSFDCVDCGQPAIEYDHHLGYAPEHRLDVQPLCRPCHGARRRK